MLTRGKDLLRESAEIWRETGGELAGDARFGGRLRFGGRQQLKMKHMVVEDEDDHKSISKS